jgi:carbon-monoxide dehydrogenase medium subunit
VLRTNCLPAKPAADRSAASQGGEKSSAEELNSDLHGSPERRAALVPVLAARAMG